MKGQTTGGQLYLHQAMGLELLGQGHNQVISAGAASGKSLVLQAPARHHLTSHPNATAVAIHPIKALARDQAIRWQSMAEAPSLDPGSINRIDGDVRDLTQRRQIMQRTRLALMIPDFIQQQFMAYSEPAQGLAGGSHPSGLGRGHRVVRQAVAPSIWPSRPVYSQSGRMTAFRASR